ncbi:transposase [Caldifermentibacillus hisashii]|uniref:transposase n=1 Tax=Caldifermentibacillus hisashii TaxID=996558 RepID=UPI0031B7384C
MPTPWAFSRFLHKVLMHQAEVEEMFDDLVRELKKIVPDFGKRLAIDSKAIKSYAAKKNKNEKEDGRRDLDADYGKKVYRGTREDGTRWEKIVKWFGYKLHLVVDASYELPIMFSVTKASVPDINEAHHLLEKMEERQPEILKKAEILTGD